MISYDLTRFFRTRWVWFARPVQVPRVDAAVFFSYEDIEAPGFKKKQGVTTVIDLTKPEQEIWKGLRKRFVREQLEKGERAGITVREGTVTEFFPLYGSFRRARGLPVDSLEPVARVGRLFVAEYQGQILAGGLFVTDGQYARAYALASHRLLSRDGRGRELAGFASRMVVWRAMKTFMKEGHHQFDLGGLDPDDTPAHRAFNEFKEAFGGIRIPCFYYRITYSPLLRFLTKLRIP